MSVGRDKTYSIDKKAASPIHHQLREILKRKIESGEFKPGDRIPTEYELCEEFSISRAPVRQALAGLVSEGLLYRQKGRGTFVNHRIPFKEIPIRIMVGEDRWVPSLKNAARRYNKTQQGMKIQLEVQALGRPQLYSKIVSAVGRGEAPDLALVDWVWMREFVDRHYIEPLDRLDRDWIEEFKTDLFPLFVRDNSYMGHLYGIQIEASVAVLWYRKDWFAAEGVAPPRSWDELAEVAHRFKKPNKFPLVFVGGTKAGETTTFQLLPFIRSAGGDLLSDSKVVLNERAVRAVRFLVDLVHMHKVTPPDVHSFGWDQAARRFAEGKACMAVGGTYEKALIQEVSGWDDEEFLKRVGYVSIPAGPGGRTATVAGGMVYVVFRQSKNPGLALEVLKRVTSPVLIQRFCKKTGRSPTRLSAIEALDPKISPFSYSVSKLLPHAMARPAIPQYAKVSEQFQLMIETAIARRAEPEEAVQKAREIMTAVIG